MLGADSRCDDPRTNSGKTHGTVEVVGWDAERKDDDSIVLTRCDDMCVM
jgi:hypothetical protein